MMYADTPSATSSPGSEAGHSLSDTPGGPMIDLFGQAPVPASHSRRPGNKQASTIPDISGQTGFGSSASVALQQSLANRLRQSGRFPGSILFVLTWKIRVTPSRRLIYALRASRRRTSGNAFGSWVSPTAQDGARGSLPPRPQDRGIPLSQQAAWATPNAEDGTGGQISPSREAAGTGLSLKAQAKNLAPWPTPSAQEFEISDVDGMEKRRAMQKALGRNGNGFGLTLAMAAVSLASWPTPNAIPENRGGCR